MDLTRSLITSQTIRNGATIKQRAMSMGSRLMAIGTARTKIPSISARFLVFRFSITRSSCSSLYYYCLF